MTAVLTAFFSGIIKGAAKVLWYPSFEDTQDSADLLLDRKALPLEAFLLHGYVFMPEMMKSVIWLIQIESPFPRREHPSQVINMINLYISAKADSLIQGPELQKLGQIGKLKN